MDYKNINDYEKLYLISENDEESRTIMFEKYKPIVFSLAKKYYSFFDNNYNVSIDDLVQEGYIGLSNAMVTFRESANTCFYTYSVICIERNIKSYCKKYNSKKNRLLNVAYPIDLLVMSKSKKDSIYYNSMIIDNDPDNFLTLDYYNNLCIEFKNSLEGNESFIFELRMNGFKYKEIAKLLDVSVSTVDRTIRNIKKKVSLYNM